MVGPVPARVDAGVKAALLGLIAETTSAGWSFAHACRVLGLSVDAIRKLVERGLGELKARLAGRDIEDE